MSKPEDWLRDKALFRSGITRTDDQETSEVLFMTSGYVYETTKQAPAVFNCETNKNGELKSLECHAAIITHLNLSEDERRKLEIIKGHIRLPIVLEHVDDLKVDIEYVLDNCRGD
jgi:O-acetylhomoserine/O-acetylserine sulfhydrylase-like pyridoxal-dependent enzyme